MNSQPNAIPDVSVDAHAVAQPATALTRPFYWALRREFWEYRAIYLAPLAAAALVLLGFLIGAVRFPSRMRAALLLSEPEQHHFTEQPYNFSAELLMGTAMLVTIFYCLDALYGERRDRSILFWKSLPVSDLTTVLTKACIPILIIPLITFAVTFVTQSVMVLLSTVVLGGSGMAVAPFWAQLHFWHMSGMLLFHLVALHGLWYAPFYGWLLLVSAWARRAPLLWAALPPLAIGIVEKIAFGTSYFGGMLHERFMGPSHHAEAMPALTTIDKLTPLTPVEFLTGPGLYVGLLVTAIFLAIAVRLRRYREPL